jgi:hypothetical protein
MVCAKGLTAPSIGQVCHAHKHGARVVTASGWGLYGGGAGAGRKRHTGLRGVA